MLVSKRACFQPSVGVMDSSSESTGSDAFEEGCLGFVYHKEWASLLLHEFICVCRVVYIV